MTSTNAAYTFDGISVLVPIYNEATSLPETLHALDRVLARLGSPFEIIAVNDGSTDATEATLQQLDLPSVVRLSHSTNRGYGAALTHALRIARYQAIVITDADGTYPIDRIPDLVAGLARHVMVVGNRQMGVGTESKARSFVKWCLRHLAQFLTGAVIPDLNSGLRAIRCDVLKPLIPILPNRFSWTSTVTVAMHTLNQPVAYIPIDYHRRTGNSKFHPVLDTLRAVQCILRAFLWARRYQRSLLNAVQT